MATTAAVDADELIAIITGAIAPTSEHLDALQLATGLPEDQLQETAMFADLPASPDHLRAFTIAQVASRLQISDDTVRREMSRGRLGFVVIGERLQRIPWSALEEILDWRAGGAA